MRARASFSRDGSYRYMLAREWGPGPRLAWVMLNPSTADAYADDPTIRRCLGFARRWGFGSLEVVNLFALRATDPRALFRHPDPVGAADDRAIQRALGRSDRVIAAWGNVPSAWRARAAFVRDALGRAWCLGTTRSGDPRHPLYVPAAAEARLLPR